MKAQCCTAIRQWLKYNDPFFRLTEVILIAVFGVFISYLQLRVANKQLALTEIQTNITRSEISPHFVFSQDANEKLPSILCKNDAHSVRRVRGDGTIYAELYSLDADSAALYTVDLSGATWVPSHITENELGGIRLFYNVGLPKLSDKFAFGGAWITDAITQKYPQSLTDAWAIRLKVYVTVSYYDATEENRTDQFVMDYPSTSVEPVSSKPIMNSTIDVRDFLTTDHKSIDANKLKEKIISEIVNKINVKPAKPLPSNGNQKVDPH